MNAPVTVPRIPLGDLIDILSGFAFKSERFGDGGEIPVIRIRDVKRGYSETFYSGEYDDRYLINDGDLLIGMDGEFNRERWKGGKALLNQRVCKISTNDRHLSSEYLYHFLPNALLEIEDRTPFATVKHLSSKDIREIEIPLPPLGEQRRIATILDKADVLRRRCKCAIELLDGLSQSIFHEMFGGDQSNNWPKATISEIAELVTDGEHQTPRRTVSGIKLLSARNVQMGYVDTTDVDYIDEDEFDRISKRLLPRPTDVLISCSGTIGRVSVLRLREPVALVRSAALIRLRPGVLPIFLEHFLRSPRMQSTMRLAANSSGQPNLFQNQIRRLEVLLPPLGLQSKFSDKIDQILRMRPSLLGCDDVLSELFASLQHRAFSGQL